MDNPGPAVRIAALAEGFRRCGMAHTVAPRTHPAGTFTADQVGEMLDEPGLVVDVLDDRGEIVEDGEDAVDRIVEQMEKLDGEQLLDLRGAFEQLLLARTAQAPAPGAAEAEAAADREARLVAACGEIDRAKESLWTKGGRPTVEAFEAATGIADLGAPECDEAWAKHEAARNAGGAGA